ncbi:MAG: type VI secretion system tip protein VgrG [Pyrinomonadaceae bacterium]|nr:type VI secretion system tip protein VgrG [Pyrinomonadaceae bacterium]MDW8304839.1 type VI secretion system tip protein VgrG [Acidobacteriota bacterium]
MTTTQKNRLISISTPLGEDFFLLQRFTAKEAISELFEVEAELLHEEKNSGHQTTQIDAISLLGQSVTIKITQKDGVERYFNGIVKKFSQIGRNVRFSRYYATIVPKVWILTQNIQSRIFQQLSVPEILKKILEGFEVSFQLQNSYEPRNYCVQYRESDFDFACRLMEEEGIFYFFEHTSNDHKMIISDTSQSHQQCAKSSIPYFINVERKEDWISSIHRWQIDYNLRSGKITLWDHNFQLPHKSLEASKSSRFLVSANKETEIYEFPAGYARKYDAIDKSGSENSSELQKIFNDNRHTAQIRAEEIDSQYKVIHGNSDCAALTAGFRFKLYNHPDQSANGEYVLTKVTHEAMQSPSYVSEEEVEDAYKNSFTCIPYGGIHPTFRPPRKTPKPIIHGSQTAYVVGPAGEEIFTDKYGRVKVQFHWDRDGKDNETSSCWLRVAQSWAGNGWGSVFIPRVGMEVIVHFLEGDPDQPIITGCVYNPTAMPPYKLPEEKTKSTIKSNSSKGSGGFNEIRFEDKKGEEQVFVHAQRRMDVRVRGSLYETCGGNRHERIGVRSDNQPGGNLVVTVGGSHDLHIKESFYIKIDQDLNESVKGSVVEDYQGNLSTIVKNKVELNALEITIEAKSKISLKVGGNCIMLDPSGITIAGTMVKINSGGFAMGTGNPLITEPLDAEPADTGEPGFLNKRRGATGRGRNQRRLQSQHYVAPPRPGEDPRITEIRNTLQHSERGRHALEVYDRYGVIPSFNPGKGSFFNGSTNTVNLDPSQNTITSALTFVHEMNHAEEYHERRTGDVHKQSKQDYINEMLQEEVDGTVASIEAKIELKQNGVDVSNAHFPLENEYLQAYQDAVNSAINNNPNLSESELDAIGRAAGRDRVMKGFQDGEVVTSTNGQKYPDYYGSYWDQVNGGGKK